MIMKKIVNYLKNFHQDYFSLPLYLMVAVYIGLLIFFNYRFDLEDSHIDKYAGTYLQILLFFVLHSLAYFGVLFIIWVYDKKRLVFSKALWIKSLLALAILSLDRGSCVLFYKWLLSGLPHEVIRFYSKIVANSYGLVTMVVPIILMKIFFDWKTGEGLYGLRFSKVDVKVYGILLLMMLPVLFTATFIPDIMDYYPSYKRTGGLAFANYYDMKEWVSVVFYETVYISDFLSTELFFRGLLVIGLSKMLGKNVVLPMVAAYATLHFGKPMGETISSVFGGYILGIIALYSRNIWGGVFIHGGIAFLMEVFAFLRM